MQEDTQNAASIAVEVVAPEQKDSAVIQTATDETAVADLNEGESAAEQAKDTEQAEKPKRKSPEREEVRLAVSQYVYFDRRVSA